MKIKFSEKFKETVSEKAIPIEEIIKREFIQYVNNVKGYTYLTSKSE
jgi:hypothetical protein